MTLFYGTNIEVYHRMKIGTMIAALSVSVVASADDRFAGIVDPTRPADTRVVEVEPVSVGPVLQSTMIAPGTKRAVISGKTYTVGERVGSATVTDIRPYEVVLDQGGREQRLRLVPSLAKQSARSPSRSAKE
jgi:hypothetical protein